MKAKQLAAWMARESRGSLGRLAFFAACLAVGVAAVTAVAGLSQTIRETIRSEARRLLAADLAIESRRPLPAEVDAVLAEVPGIARASVKELPTVVAALPRVDGAPGESALVELKVVDGPYPFYGELALAPAAPLAELTGADGCVVAPELLERLSLAVGDTLVIGGAPFGIRGVVVAEPDKLNVSFTLGPRVFLSEAGFARAGLARGIGTRIEYRALVRVPDEPGVEAVAERLRARLADSEFVSVETWKEAQPALREGLDNAEKFLGLVALLSLLVGGIGVAQATRAWLAGRLDAIAVLRSLGARPREILLLYVGQATLLGAAGSVFGVALGVAVERIVPAALEGLLPVDVRPSFHPGAALRGMALGLGVALAFALPPLLDVLRVPPVRVLRRDAEPLPRSRAAWTAVWGLVLAAVAATAIAQSGSWRRGILFVVGLAIASGLLALAARGVMRAVAAFPRDAGGVALRHGLAALARPGAGTLGAIVALGVGVLVVLGMYLVQDRLSAQLRSDLPEEAPTAFLIDIQPNQWDGVRALLEGAGGLGIESSPVVTARIRAIDGRPVAELVAEAEGQEGRERWMFTREQRLSTMAELPQDNAVVEGALWSDPARNEVSIEQDYARDLGVRLGSTISLDVQGVPLELSVTSIRTVEWERFSLNFFLIVEPGVLDRAPQFRIATVRLPREAERAARDRMAAAYPNVTWLQLREILEKVVAVLDRVGLGVRAVGGFTVLSGIAILAGAIAAGSVRRAREVALLKTLGMTRRGVVGTFATEYALIGTVAGLVGTAGAVALAWAVTRFGFEFAWRPRPLAWIVAVLATVLLVVLAGIGASAGALSRRPVEVLRQE